jgi:hypothetical protein
VAVSTRFTDAPTVTYSKPEGPTVTGPNGAPDVVVANVDTAPVANDIRRNHCP